MKTSVDLDTGLKVGMPIIIEVGKNKEKNRVAYVHKINKKTVIFNLDGKYIKVKKERL